MLTSCRCASPTPAGTWAWLTSCRGWCARRRRTPTRCVSADLHLHSLARTCAAALQFFPACVVPKQLRCAVLAAQADESLPRKPCLPPSSPPLLQTWPTRLATRTSTPSRPRPPLPPPSRLATPCPSTAQCWPCGKPTVSGHHLTGPLMGSSMWTRLGARVQGDWAPGAGNSHLARVPFQRCCLRHLS